MRKIKLFAAMLTAVLLLSLCSCADSSEQADVTAISSVRNEAIAKNDSGTVVKTVDAANPVYNGDETDSMPPLTDGQSADSYSQNPFANTERWITFVNSILTSLIIAVSSLAIGTLLGVGVYMLYRKRGQIFKKFIVALAWFIKGIPEVLFILILYCATMVGSVVTATLVSIAAFTVIVTCNVFSMIRNGAEAVDKGQTEAALALGYTDKQGFFRIVFPQAIQHIMPNYKACIISLLKSTAVVGYAVLQDFTQISTIIQSKTPALLVPLTVMTALYFMVSWLLIMLAEKIQINILPIRKNGKQFLEEIGVSTEGNKS